MSEKEQHEHEQPLTPVTTAEEEAAQAADTATEKKKPHRSHRSRQHRSHAGWWVLLVTIIVLGGAGTGAGWYAYQWYLQSQQQITSLQQAQTNLMTQNQKLSQQFNDRLTTLAAKQQELTKYVEVIRQRDTHLRKDWLVMEADYLLQLASYRLLFERDINTAIVALHSADQRLKDAGDPALINTRKEIANAIQGLKQVDQADLAGLSLTMSALIKELGELPTNTPDPVAKIQESNADLSETKNVSSWRELPAAIWRDLKSLIVIRQHDQPVAPLLSPQQRFFLVENLRLELEQARLAMLTGQAEVYQERIQTAKQWIEKHFDKEAAVTKAALDTLQQLQEAAIAPELPDISSAYQALQKYEANAEQTGLSETPATQSNGTN